MEWSIRFSARARKQTIKLPERIAASLEALVYDMQEIGPRTPLWPNFGKLKGKQDCYHCHLNKGSPRFVAVSKVVDREIRIIEVRYVGTHEKADYKRLC